jgi:ribonuclease VapC
MTSYAPSVFDASAIMALVFHEPGADKLTARILAGATASTVNVAEVQARLVSRGQSPDDAWQDSLAFVADVEPFTLEQAKVAGTLVAQTKPYGLSLGDRACLALALELNAPVYTTDKIWANLINLGIPIHILR